MSPLPRLSCAEPRRLNSPGVSPLPAAHLPSLTRSPSQAGQSVAELKGRLRELGFDTPTNASIVNRGWLLSLVEEAERLHSQALQPLPDASASRVAEAPASPASVKLEPPAPWFQQESRSKPGRFYFVNRETGEKTFDPWFQRESRSTPGRFYFINVNTGESTWEAPSRRWKEALAAQRQKQVELAESPRGRCKEIITGGEAQHGEEPGRATSDAGNLQCEFGASGVKALSLAAGPDDLESAEFRQQAEAVEGKEMTWIRGPLIGRGSLGRVFKAANMLTGEIMAVKEVPINCMDQNDEFRESVENEVSIMRRLEHKHIVRYLGHDYVDGCLCLYLEHMPGGTVSQALENFGAFEESLLASCSRQILQGLEYLHNQSPPIMHRDIKGSNILIGSGCLMKLADFGCSIQMVDTLTDTTRGSVPWMAPEVLAHSRYGRAADLWSFGCTVIEMATADLPWGRFDHHFAALLKIGLSQETPPLPEAVSERCKGFIGICVRRDPDSRSTASKLLEHEFLTADLKGVDYRCLQQR